LGGKYKENAVFVAVFMNIKDSKKHKAIFMGFKFGKNAKYKVKFKGFLLTPKFRKKTLHI
jgi:hypothetical protein